MVLSNTVSGHANYLLFLIRFTVVLPIPLNACVVVVYITLKLKFLETHMVGKKPNKWKL